jgi:hypothetical protein
MIKWEYCSIMWGQRPVPLSEEETKRLEREGWVVQEKEGRTIVQIGLLRYAASSEGPQKISDLDATMADLGRKGWELINHVAVERIGGAEVLFFKRPMLAPSPPAPSMF